MQHDEKTFRKMARKEPVQWYWLHPALELRMDFIFKSAAVTVLLFSRKVKPMDFTASQPQTRLFPRLSPDDLAPVGIVSGVLVGIIYQDRKCILNRNSAVAINICRRRLSWQERVQGAGIPFAIRR